MKHFVLVALLLSSNFAFSEEEVVNRPKDEKYEEGWTRIKKFSAKEIKATCRKFEGKYIGYYDELYKVENCKRREVTKGKKLMTRKTNVKVHIVEADVVAKIPVGKPLDSQSKTHRRSCKELEGTYVTYTFTNVFLVKDCKLKKFPDWETFQAHRKKNKTLKKPIIALNESEFFNLRQVRPMSSVIDKVFQSVLTGEAGVDVVPVDEACAGIEGKDVFYYSKIYRIEKCRKREYDAENFIKRHKGQVALVELESSQWLSLPNGKPMDDKNKKKSKR